MVFLILMRCYDGQDHTLEFIIQPTQPFPRIGFEDLYFAAFDSCHKTYDLVEYLL